METVSVDDLKDCLIYLKDIDRDNVDDKDVGIYADNLLKGLIQRLELVVSECRPLTPEDELREWFPAECERCGFKGSSSEWEGGHAIADTGDYSDPSCPKCGCLGCEETDNMQLPQDKRPYDIIQIQRDTIGNLEDSIIDLTYSNGILKHKTNKPLPKLRSRTIEIKELAKDYWVCQYENCVANDETEEGAIVKLSELIKLAYSNIRVNLKTKTVEEDLEISRIKDAFKRLMCTSDFNEILRIQNEYYADMVRLAEKG